MYRGNLSVFNNQMATWWEKWDGEREMWGESGGMKIKLKNN